MPDGLIITVRFPRRAYSGGDYGMAEEIPSPARLHAAFVAAAGGGPAADLDGRVLVSTPAHADAVRFLEEHEPIGLIAPAAVVNRYEASRFRVRAAVDHNNETVFEPFAALAGPVVYVWPPAAPETVGALQELAAEITHVGAADSIALVDVRDEACPADHADFLRIAPGRGSGRALRVPVPGRLETLVDVHRATQKPGGYGAGSRGVQAVDEAPERAGERATALRRFASSHGSTWPYAEAWIVELPDRLRWCLDPRRRVLAATRIHRALVAAIADDVPSFITGRDGGGPLRGAGHLAIQLTRLRRDGPPVVVLGIPSSIAGADRSRLLDALADRVPVRMGKETMYVGEPTVRPANRFWGGEAALMETEAPIVLDTPGTPRHAPWTLDDAVICSVGYALRGVLEADGLEWEQGWAFRRHLVARLRERGVDARARRVMGDVSRYAHRAREGDLLVAVDAWVALGELGTGAELLALGRARHLGGGLLRPASDGS